MAKSSIPPLIGSNFITWHHNGRQFSISKQDGRFVKVRELLKARKFEEALLQLDKPAAIAKYTGGKVQVYGDAVTYNGETVHGTVVERILAFVEEGLPFEPLVAFLNNLYENTDKEIRDALYDFIEWNGLTITDDGAFVAYKLVSDNGKPIYYDTGLITYKLGETYEMPKCDTTKARGECDSRGYYAGAKTYWKGSFDVDGNYTGSGIMYVAKIFPQHVISVPANSQKLCVYKFQIIEEYKKVVNEFKKPLYKYNPPTEAESDDEEYFEDECAQELENDPENCCGGNCGCAEAKEKSKCGAGYTYGDDIVSMPPERDKFGRFLAKGSANNAKPKRDSHGRFKSVKKSTNKNRGTNKNKSR